MKYAGMPMGMWVLFLQKSFREQLCAVFGYDEKNGKGNSRKGKAEI